MNGCLGGMQMVVCMCLSLLCISAARAATLDCAKARTRVEKSICHEPLISRLDAQLGKAYQNAPQCSAYNRAAV
jgi:uncharacterized protein